MVKSNQFLFLQDLNPELFQRYLSIEDSLKSTSGNVYVFIQAYLEKMFKFISKREGYNIPNYRTLGDYLKNNHIINFCLVRLEFDDLDLLKKINYYGNNHKHEDVIEFNFIEFSKFMKGIHSISYKIYCYYKKQTVNPKSQFDANYYEQLIKEAKEREAAQEIYQANITTLQAELAIKQQVIDSLQEVVSQNETELELISGQKTSLELEVLKHEEKIKDLKNRMEERRLEMKGIVEENRDLNKSVKDLISELSHLRDYEHVTKYLLKPLPSIIDLDFLKKK